MNLSGLDVLIFLGFIGFVVTFSMWKSRKEKNSEDYFLAGRGLKWWLIGFSIVAANISTEQFVGMAGQGAGNVGLAVSGYQLLGAVTIVFVAVLFLPRFLRAGIFTMPEYLEYRYNNKARAIMVLYTMVIYVGVTIAAVLYSGGLTLQTIFGDSSNHSHLVMSILIIGAVAAVYTTFGGLKAVVWADLFQGSGLILGGLVTMVLGFIAIGGVAPFFKENASRLHMVLPSHHPEMPWTVLLIGLWIPNLYYCGFNQFIVQRSLGAKSLRHGQLGIIFAAALWLLIPFVIVFPGIMAYQLYGGSLTNADQAYPMLIKNLIPAGIRGFIFAALCGAVISSLASVLNSASTIFTMDLYKKYLRPKASEKNLVNIGRTMTLIFVAGGCLIAFNLGSFSGIFSYIQEFNGFISPGIVAAFLFGFIFRKAPPSAGVLALGLTVPVYGLLYVFCSGVFETITVIKIAFLNRMALTFIFILLAMGIVTVLKPMKQRKTMPVKSNFDMRPSPSVLWLGGAVISAVIAFFIIFW